MYIILFILNGVLITFSSFFAIDFLTRGLRYVFDLLNCSAGLVIWPCTSFGKHAIQQWVNRFYANIRRLGGRGVLCVLDTQCRRIMLGF